jgi:hypothetical protein
MQHSEETVEPDEPACSTEKLDALLDQYRPLDRRVRAGRRHDDPSTRQATATMASGRNLQ